MSDSFRKHNKILLPLAGRARGGQRSATPFANSPILKHDSIGTSPSSVPPASRREALKSLAKKSVEYFLRALISIYRHTLSSILGRHCRFLPTCSAYADEAIHLHGPIKGSQLAFRRFCRCHPWGGQGFDPVPLPPHR